MRHRPSDGKIFCAERVRTAPADTMLSAARTYNLAVVIAEPIPWYGPCPVQNMMAQQRRNVVSHSEGATLGDSCDQARYPASTCRVRQMKASSRVLTLPRLPSRHRPSSDAAGRERDR